MAHLLVTNCTPRTGEGGVYLLDSASGAVQKVMDQPCRGITRGPDGVYVVGNHGLIFHLQPRTWEATLRKDTGLRGTHDLRWIDGAFYVVASIGNRVVRLDPALEPLDEMRIVEDPDDICHANCLIRGGGELLLTIFTLSPGRREDKRRTSRWRSEGKILRLDWERKRYDILYEPLWQPHSLVWQEDGLLCCESFTSELALLDLASRSKRRLRRLHGFLRGLAVGRDAAFAGVSWNRASLPLADRLRRLGRLRCGVLELDPRTWKPRRQFAIPGSEVYDLLILDED